MKRPSVGKDVEKQELSYAIDGAAEQYKHFREQ